MENMKTTQQLIDLLSMLDRIPKEERTPEIREEIEQVKSMLKEREGGDFAGEEPLELESVLEGEIVLSSDQDEIPEEDEEDKTEQNEELDDPVLKGGLFDPDVFITDNLEVLIKNNDSEVYQSRPDSIRNAHALSYSERQSGEYDVFQGADPFLSLHRDIRIASSDHLDSTPLFSKVNNLPGNDVVILAPAEQEMQDIPTYQMLYGTRIIDHMRGTSGNDILRAGVSNDWITPSAGRDYIDGGEGTDYLFVTFLSGVTSATLDLAAGTLETNITGIDTITNVEGFLGSLNDDTISGDENDNLFDGYWGNDVINGRGGDDGLFGGEGADMLTGGAGSDRFYLRSADTSTDFDTISDFSLLENDVLDVSGWLSGYDYLTEDISNFARFVDSGADSRLQVNPTGAGSFFDVALVLGGAGLDAQTLEGSGHLFTSQQIQQTYKFSDPEHGEGGISYGLNVDMYGDMIVVAAPGAKSNDAGAAYVYNGNQGYMLDSPTGEASGYYASDVAVNGAYILVGHSGADGDGVNEGRAYIYNASDGSLLYTWASPAPDNFDVYGGSVDLNDTYAVISEVQNGNEGSVHVYTLSDGNLAYTIDNPNTSAGDRFGADATVTDNYLVAGDGALSSGGMSNVGALYIYDISTGTLLNTIINPDPDQNDYFGYTIDASDDYVVASVARNDLAGTTDAGSVYVFDTSSGGLIYTIDNPNPQAYDRFGSDVHLHDHYMVVGSATDGNLYTGTVQVYDLNSGSLVHMMQGENGGDYYGTAISTYGDSMVVSSTDAQVSASSLGEVSRYQVDFSGANDMTGDDLDNMLVGLDGDDTIRGGDGADFIYGSIGADQLYGGAGADSFMYSWADIDGNIDVIHDFDIFEGDKLDLSAIHFNFNESADALSDYVRLLESGSDSLLQINVNGTGNNADYVTAARIVDGAVWSTLSLFTHEAVTLPVSSPLAGLISNPSPDASDIFSADIDVDGNNIIVSSMFNVVSGERAGSVYIYDSLTGNLTLQIDNPTPDASDYFGNQVMLSDNYIAVSANGEDATEFNSGRVYIYNRSDGSLRHTLSDITLDSNEQFGRYMEMTESYTLVSLTSEDNVGNADGVVRVYDTATGTYLYTIANPEAEDGDQFAYSMAIEGDYAVFGVPYDDNGLTNNTGEVYVYDLSAQSVVRTISAPASSESGGFGQDVDVYNDYIVVGAPQVAKGAATQAGEAYIFEMSTGNLLHTIANPTPSAADYFGNVVAIYGDYFAVSSPYKDSESTDDEGRVYLYDIATGSLAETIFNPEPQGYDGFGRTLEMEDGYLAISSPYKDKEYGDEGAAFLYQVDTMSSGNLSGTSSADQLYGLNGADTLYAGAGNDVLDGGAGSDVLYGQAGADRFVFDGDILTNADTVADFNVSEGDVLDISDIIQFFDPTFTPIADFIRLSKSGADAILEIDHDGISSGQNYVAAVTISNGAELRLEDLYLNGNIDMIA